MTITERNEYYKYFLEKYGMNTQLNMVIEEMSELTKEICKLFRGKGDINNLTLEIADVEIMIEQLKFMFKIEQPSIDEIKDSQLKRATSETR